MTDHDGRSSVNFEGETMDGLRGLLNVVAAVCLCHTACAVASPFSDGDSTGFADSTGNLNSVAASVESGNEPPVCAVIGDVSAPNTFHCPEDQPFSLRDALNAAGMVADSASVFIVRPSTPLPWTEFVSRDSADPGPPLMPGDIVVVHSENSINSGVQPTAVLVKDGQPLVLALQGDVARPVLLGDVLRHCELPPEQIARIQLVSARAGRSRTGLEAAFAIQHGDVLLTSTANRAAINQHQANTGNFHASGARRTTQFAPLVTEWNESTGNLTSSSATTPSERFSLPATSADTGFQSVNNTTTVSNAETIFDNTSNPGSGLQILPADPALLPPVDEYGQPQLMDQLRGLNSAAASEDETAPVPPSEILLPTAPAQNAFWWNVAFIMGLLTAGGLIIFGWLKSEAELRAARYGQGHTKRSDDDQHSLLNSEVLIHNSVDDEPTMSNALDFRDLKTRQDTSGTELVDRHEWFEGSWMKSEHAAEVDSESSPVKPVHSEPVHSAAAPRFESEAASAAVETSDLTAGSKDFHELNDLIANRLPVDLCQTNLPLRVTLFGRPAGPRRLRIDAAHTELAGPHMLAADRRRKEVEMAPTGAVPHSTAQMVHQELRTDHFRSSESGIRVDSIGRGGPLMPSSGTGDLQSPTGSLDRALNFLHEQGE